MTVVSVRKDGEYNAYLTKAEGLFGTHMSWISDGEPSCKPGDEFSIKLDWKWGNEGFGSDVLFE